jgi:hypothetical protein
MRAQGFAPLAAFFFFFFFFEPTASSRSKLEGGKQTRSICDDAMEDTAALPHHCDIALCERSFDVLLETEHGGQVAC